MSEWKTIAADEFCESVRDGTHDTPKPTTNGFKLVTGKHLKNGVIDPTDAYYISEADYNKINERSKVDQWDVLMSMIGTIGEVAVVKDEPNYAIKNIALFKCSGSEMKGKWLAYYLSSPIAKGYFSGNQKGSSQQFLSLKQLRNLPILVAEESYMRYVVEILSRYDTLIENYQKQIKLLEEAAQRLYKEWFVDLRFPGYENAKMVDGLPEGWERKKLGEVCEVNKTSIAKNYAYNYVNYNDLGNVREGSIQEPVRYVYGQEPGRAKRVAKDGDVIWGMVRPNLKSYALVQNPKPQDVYSTGFAVLSSKAVPFSFLYCAVITDDFVGYLVNCTNCAAYPAVKAVHFENAVLLVPSRSLLDEFSKFAEPLFRKCGKLSSQIRLLTEARDRLLPKLMGGEMEVDAPKGQRATSIEQRSGHNEQTTNAPKGQKH